MPRHPTSTARQCVFGAATPASPASTGAGGGVKAATACHTPGPAGGRRSTRAGAHETSIHLIKYMGSKREILGAVTEAVRRVTPAGATVLDIFAGTHAVGYALREDFRIIASDIQAYSKPIGETLLKTWALPSAEEIWACLKPHYERNLAALQDIYAKPLAEEAAILAGADPSTDEEVQAFAAFQHSLPDPVGWFTDPPAGNGSELNAHLWSLVSERHAGVHDTFPYVQTAAYFANTYVGIFHALQIDSVRYAIDQAYPEGHPVRASALAALMFAVSYINCSPGHFAMWRDATNPRNAADILLYRRRDLLSYFMSKLAELSERLTMPFSDTNEVWTRHYEDALADLGDVTTVYADPPYSAVHYSRFYHLLESLVRYDYPAVAHRGRFREDRHQSPFCIRSKVHDAFRALAEPLAARGIRLVLSYANTGMIAPGELLALLRDVYADTGYAVWSEEVAHQHSTMGRLGDKTRDVREALIFCAPQDTPRAAAP
jgi:adenine-specific DNA-methyltransferase